MTNNDELKAKIEGLRQELQTASQITPEERDLWTSMMTDIVNLSNSDNEVEQSFRKSLEEKGAAYEAEHPKITFAVRQVLDMLAKMGI